MINRPPHYIIVHDDGIIALQNEVNRKIEEGYTPEGNMVVSNNGDRNNDSPIFCQPMVLSLWTYMVKQEADGS